ncbi:hypothetical protein SAMN04487944_13021 [Gracilibacillus ureilyticus]|uniref:Uncharacterized protein n=1 Tax=Gracilibacillus ureilyticus TaxID=531814 RepID=A0A1H9VZ64_9BACI|nr:hypothetical protein SAMN04487944_13021 [Gracilibacillus ureilyticus]
MSFLFLEKRIESWTS